MSQDNEWSALLVKVLSSHGLKGAKFGAIAAGITLAIPVALFLLSAVFDSSGNAAFSMLSAISAGFSQQLLCGLGAPWCQLFAANQAGLWASFLIAGVSFIANCFFAGVVFAAFKIFTAQGHQ